MADLEQQFKEMSTARTHFVFGDENQPPVNVSPAAVSPNQNINSSLLYQHHSSHNKCISVAKMRIIWLQMESTLEQFFPRARLKTVLSRLI